VRHVGRHRRLRVAILSAALGLSVWSAAFTFTQASFSEGDVLSAASLNALLNDNFQAASDAIDAKLGVTGGTVTGRLNITADAVEDPVLGAGGRTTTFFVRNEAAEGETASILSANSSQESPALLVGQEGPGAAVTLKAAGGGDFIQAFSGFIPSFRVQNDGTVSIVSENASLTLHAATGTIENQVGSGLPLAFGVVDTDGDKLSGTSNWSSSYDAGEQVFTISLVGTAFDPVVHTVSLNAIRTDSGDAPVAMSLVASNGKLIVQAQNALNGDAGPVPFSFTIHDGTP